MEFQDPKVFTQATIRAVVQNTIEKETGIPQDQWTQREWDMWTDAVFDGEAGIGNPIYQDAFATWADINLKTRGANSFVPGGIRTRYGPRDQMLYGDLTDQQRQDKTLMNSGSREDVAITQGVSGLREVGTELGRNAYKAWNNIAYMNTASPSNIEWTFIDVNGERFYSTDIANMTDYQRKQLADRWVGQYVGGTDALAAYRQERDVFLMQHPETGSFKDFQSGVYRYEGGPRAWRKDFAKDHPEFASAMEEKEQRLRDPGEYGTGVGHTQQAIIDRELDQWAASQEAYKVANGIRDSVYDPAVKPTKPDYGFTDSSSGGGTSTPKAPKTETEKSRDAITSYNDKLQKAIAVMNSAGYNVTEQDIIFMNPYYKRAYGMFDLPPMPYDANLYYQWVYMQPPGTDTSIDAYFKVLEQMGYSPAA